MITKGEAAGKTKEFIDYVLSEKGQTIVEEEGFVRIK
jgi:ABC-type phosphate transport system substrate-binding protein